MNSIRNLLSQCLGGDVRVAKALERLHDAASNGDVASLTAAIRVLRDVDTPDSIGRSALQVAADTLIALGARHAPLSQPQADHEPAQLSPASSNRSSLDTQAPEAYAPSPALHANPEDWHLLGFSTMPTSRAEVMHVWRHRIRFNYQFAQGGPSAHEIVVQITAARDRLLDALAANSSQRGE